MDKSSEQESNLSGLHRYTGDPVHLKLRILFTDATQIAKKPDTSILSHQKQHKQFKKYPDRQLDDESVSVQGSAQSRASYLLTKRNSPAANWNIEQEVLNDSAQISSPLSSQSSSKKNDSLAALLHQRGFKLRVVSVPTSRMNCLACNTTANNNSIPIESRSSCFDNFEQTKNTYDRLELSNGTNNSREHMVRSNENYVFADFLQSRNEIKSRDLLVKRQRASDCRDSPSNMTSDDDCDDHWKRTHAHKLAAIYYVSKKHNRSTIAAANTVSLLMRNHYLPSYKPCHCSSRMSMARNIKSLNDSGSLLCSLCSCSGTRDNQHQNLDRQIDNLCSPILAFSRRCQSSVSINAICHCCCHCSDFSEGYKRWQKLFNRLDHKDNSNVAVLSNVLSRNGFVQIDAADEDFSRNKQPKYDDGDGNSIDYSSNDSFDLLLASSAHKTGTKEDNGANISKEKPSSSSSFCGSDQTFENFHSKESNSRGEFAGNQKISASANEISIEQDKFNAACREWKKLESRSESCDLGQNVTGRCRCSESHGETLFVIMEKYTPRSEKEPHEFTDASSDNHTNFTTKNTIPMFGADRLDERELDITIGSGIIGEKSDSRVPDINEQVRLQHRQQEPPSKQELDERCSSFSQPTDKFLGTVSSSDDHETNGSVQEAALRPETLIRHNQELENERQDKSMSSLNEHNAQSDPLVDSAINNTNDSIEADQRQRLQQLQRHRRQRQLQSSPLKINVNVEHHAAAAAAAAVANEDDDGTVEQRQHVELEYSILLAVIVIDVFDKTVQMKPDLNKLIMIDLKTLIAPNDATCDFVSGVVNLHMHETNGPIQMRQSHFDRLFYHVESVQSTDVMNIMEYQIEIVRHSLGLTQRGEKFAQNFELISPTKVLHQLVKDDLTSFLSPTNNNVLVKLQFAIQCVQDLPSDCRNIHIKYKLFSRYNKRWRFRRRNQEIKVIDNERLGLINDDDGTTLAAKASKFTTAQQDGSAARKDELKLDHMTQFRGAWPQNLDQSLASANQCSHNDSLFATINSLAFTSRQHSTSRIRDEARHDGNGSDDTPEHSNESSLFLILQGSTVTSRRPNQNGCFHLCCTEQVLLELSRRGNNFRSQHSDNSLELVRSRKGDDVIGKQKIIHKSADKNDHSKQSQMIDNFPPIDSRVLNSSSRKDLTASPAIISESDSRIKLSDTILLEHVINSNKEDLKTCSKCSRTKNTCICGRQTHDASHTRIFRDVQDELCFDDDNDLCELVLVFEIYSSDFYGDKLQGWSHTNIPISVSRLSLMNSDKECNLLQPAASRHSPSASMNHEVYSNNKCTHAEYELPVIRPAFCAPMDRLRYYLIGDIPKTVPQIESFVSSNNRYMMQTQQNGKLVLDYEVLRQFSDVELDSALEDLFQVESKSTKPPE